MPHFRDSWIPSFPRSVQFKNGYLIDKALKQVYSPSVEERVRLEQIDGARLLRQITGNLASKNISPHIDFYIGLNKSGLLDFKVPFGLQVAQSCLLTLKILGFYLPFSPWPARRLDPPRESLLKTFCFILTAFLKSTLPVATIGIASLGTFFIIVGFAYGAVIVVGIAISIATGIVLHEMGHIAAIPKTEGERRFFVSIVGPTLAVVKPRMDPVHEFKIALCGPLTTITVALSSVMISLFISGWWKAFFVAEGTIFFLLSISILPFFSDGKAVFSFVSPRRKCTNEE